jgi:ABC-type phosphate transport system substrate-binding protein
MINRIAAILLCTAAPVALIAQEVNLRSPDEFISVDGEIVGFNGVMLSVQTIVGQVSVPAAEVICYGEACLDVLANNDFGLTAEALAGVVTASSVVPQSAAPADTAPAPLGNDLTIAFASPAAGAFYSSVAGSVANAQVSGTTVSLPDGTTMTTSSDLSAADIAVQTVSFQGDAEVAFAIPSGWASNPRGLTHQLVGLNGFAVQASPSTGLTAISMEDLARVFSGEVTNWSQIGGSNLPVLGLRLPDTSPVFQEMAAVVLEPTGRQVASGVLAMGDEAGITASVNQFPGSIAIVSARNANPDLTIPVAGACGIAVAPTPFNIISGDYPLVRPLMASYGGAAPASVAAFFDIAASDAAQGIGQTLGMIDYSATFQDAATKNARISGLLGATLDEAQRAAAAQMFQTLFSANRLSTTFFGGPVSGTEAAWNRAKMIDLAEALAAPEFAGREIAFVGVGTSDAGSDAAIAVSARAAAEMQAAFEAFASAEIASAGVTLSSFGFGDVAATTCIDSQVANGEAAHVEVWVR